MDDRFFEQYGRETVKHGKLTSVVTLDKHETFIEATFSINGTVQLVCDRSLEEFDYPVDLTEHMVFKYGEETREVSEDVTIIEHNTQTLDMGQYLYEYIVLSLPMKKLHPKFKDERSEGEPIVYKTDQPEPSTDPRWDKLKNIK